MSFQSGHVDWHFLGAGSGRPALVGSSCGVPGLPSYVRADRSPRRRGGPGFHARAGDRRIWPAARDHEGRMQGNPDLPAGARRAALGQISEMTRRRLRLRRWPPSPPCPARRRNSPRPPGLGRSGRKPSTRSSTLRPARWRTSRGCSISRPLRPRPPAAESRSWFFYQHRLVRTLPGVLGAGGPKSRVP
jgi:hypothetical protein